MDNSVEYRRGFLEREISEEEEVNSLFMKFNEEMSNTFRVRQAVSNREDIEEELAFREGDDVRVNRFDNFVLKDIFVSFRFEPSSEGAIMEEGSA